MGKKIIPSSLEEALLALNSDKFEIVSGGSDKMLQHKVYAGEIPNFENVIFLMGLDELHYEKIVDGKLHIGATMTLEEILNHKDTPQILKDCLNNVGSVHIRHFASLPGNIANASPACDTIPVEIALNAELKLTSINGSRYIKVDDFVKGVRKTDLEENELIEEIIFPLDDLVGVWYKVGSRKEESISKVSFAGAYKIEGDVIKDIRLCFGSVFKKAIRSYELENKLIGMNLKDLSPRIEEFVSLYGEIIAPIDDQRSTKTYRQNVTENIVRKFLSDLVKGGK